MYSRYFGLQELPFSIAPNPRYLYMSKRHREALVHLLYGVSGDGGFVLLTGEVGTGKTTISRSLLQQLPDKTDVAFILNPYQSTIELLATICDELGIAYISDGPSAKELTELLHHYLLSNHGNGRNTVLMIDEAQLLPFETLEQIRLLTNLETDSKKLLQIILIGQPELKIVLSRPELSQLAQRITARYHIGVMTQAEVRAYILHRLAVAGCDAGASLFPDRVVAEIYRLSQGVPRVVNVLCDRALLGTYSQHRLVVNKATLALAAKEVLGDEAIQSQQQTWLSASRVTAAVAVILAVPALWLMADKFLAGGPLGEQLLGGTTMAEQANDTVVAAPVFADRQIPPASSEQAVTDNKANAVSQVVPLNGEAMAHQPTTIMPNDLDERGAIVAVDAGVTAVDSRRDEIWRSDFAGQLQRLVNSSGLIEIDQPVDCQGLPTGFACLPLSLTSWSAVKELNRPLLLRQQVPQSAVSNVSIEPVRVSKQAVLAGISANQATLITGDGLMTLSLLELGEQWSGEAIAIWRKPAAFEQPIGYGSQGEMVAWLATAFATLDQQTMPLADQYFNRALEQRVKLFQRYNQLRDDGVVGINTLLKINQQLYRPSLLQQPVSPPTSIRSTPTSLSQQGGW
jgi:general secretion pathway protein A